MKPRPRPIAAKNARAAAPIVWEESARLAPRAVIAMKDNEKKFSLPMLESPRTVRVMFRKVGNLQYISHLDLQRTFQRVLVRAGLPLWYTKGFNPHIKMVFGMPLPVGCESECEFLDIRIEREMSEEEIMERLNAELTSELAVREVYLPTSKFTEMAFVSYELVLTLPNADEALAESIGTLFAGGPLYVTKRSKSGEKTVDVKDFLRAFSVKAENGEICMHATLASGLTPEALIKILREKMGLFEGDPLKERYRILRRAVLLADGETEFR
jgi:radical SAM-linked protein